MSKSPRKPTDGLTHAVPAVPPAEPGDVVRIEGLFKSFDGRPVLEDVHLRVPSSKIVSIIGQSGGGKTTLLRCVNLLERPDRALMEISGEEIFSGERLFAGTSRDCASALEWSFNASICSHT